GGAAYASQGITQLNAKLIQSERAFLNEQGLPGRPWFKHMIYAPGAYTGYAVKTMPFIREAIEQKKWQEAEQGSTIVGEVLQKEATLVEDAAKQLEALTGKR